jgi:D-alanyl-lipoteichoic acid acyltransferase DltB (MBOAT superfamily)
LTEKTSSWYILFFLCVWMAFSGACFIIVMIASILHGAVPTYVFYEVFVCTAAISFGTTILYKKEKPTFQKKDHIKCPTCGTDNAIILKRKITLTSLQSDIKVQEGCA